MGKSNSTLISIGGGEIAESPEILDEIARIEHKKPNARMLVMTVATSEPEAAAEKYRSLFRKIGFKHVDVVDVSTREDAFNDRSAEKVRTADILFFTGGDQLNITSLMGGSPLHNLLHERYSEGVVISGSSAGAAMMSGSMIISGESNNAPTVSGVEIAPGMDLIGGTIIDTHFSQRGRHGRLLTAVAHYPQALGIGLDEKTGIVVKNGDFKVIGEGTVTVFDGSKMKHLDLPYKVDHEPVGMFDMCIHVLPSGYTFDLKARQPGAPPLKKLAGSDSDI
jgi:cyanophycinase